MRLIRILQVGCVTGVAASPVLAAEQPQDPQARAIEILRATPTPPSAISSTGNWREDVSIARDEREKALQAEVRVREALRQKRLEERKAAWELSVAQRSIAMRENAQ